MGAVLSQLDGEMVEYPVAYATRSYNSSEQNYSSFDRECLAVVWATTHFRHYLFGNSFTSSRITSPCAGPLTLRS